MGLFYSKPASVKSVLYTNDYVNSLPSLTGKNIVITGTSLGSLGYVATECCLRKGATVICLNRSEEKAAGMKESLLKQDTTFSSKLHLVKCDLMDMDSVRSAAGAVKSIVGENGVDVLCNNAGVMMLEDTKNKDGSEIQMTSNHLSHFLLTKELFPLIEAASVRTGDARIINHSSMARKTPEVDLKEDSFKKNVPLGDNSPNGRMARYQQSKLANCVFTYSLHEKLQAKGSKIKSLVCHPGLAASNLQVVTADSSWMISMYMTFFMAKSQSVEDGAVPLIKCITDPALPSGTFLGPTEGDGWMRGPPKVLAPESILNSRKNMDILWKGSEESLGIKFDV